MRRNANTEPPGYLESPGATTTALAGTAFRTSRAAWHRLNHHRAGLLAAGVAFYALLSLFPAIAALVALAGLWMSPDQILASTDAVRALMPQDAAGILLSQLEQIASAPNGGLQFAALVGFGIALYSASRAAGSLVEGVLAVLEIESERGWLGTLLQTLGLTFLLLCVAVLTLASVLIVPIAIGVALPDSAAAPWIALLRWPIVAGFILLAVATVYRSARRAAPGTTPTAPPQRRFLTTGAILAAIVILPASIGFSVYVENFADYNKSFGTLGGVVTLLVWLWLSAFIVIGGAAFDAEDALADGRIALPPSGAATHRG